MKQKVQVSELKFGMYVYELDRPWTETPFVFQGFLLQSADQLETLSKFCQHVFVDTERSEGEGKALAAGASAGSSSGGVRRVAHVEKISVEHELARARGVLTKVEDTLQGTLEKLKSGEELPAEEVRGAVAEMTESMLRNPDALVLLSALKERGGYFLERALQVSIYMIAFARFIGMEHRDIELAGLAGLLQDIGMLQVSEAIVTKKEPLSPGERIEVQAHIERGVTLLASVSHLPPEIAEIAALHHERADGSGYPKGLQGSAISVLGAVAGIVDCFSALTSDRPYADRVAPSNALGMLHKWRDKLFLPSLVEQFIRCIGVFPVGSVVELNTGEIGVVISQNQVKRLLPRVMVVRDAKGQPLKPQKLLDLSKLPKANAEEHYQIRRTLEYGRAGVGMKDLFL